MDGYDPADNARKSYDLAIKTMGEKLASFRREIIGDCTLYLGDCQSVMPLLPQVDAVITDPPYHGVKSDAWDNQWKSDNDFLDFIADVASAADNLLAPNGSLYHFCSPQMASRVEVRLGEWFKVVNHIVWDKGESRKGAAGTGVDVTALRSFWSANTERIIFAEKLASDATAADASGYQDACQAVKATIIGNYLRDEFSRAGVSNKQIAALFPSKTGRPTGCVSNWLLGLNVPTPEQYQAMRERLNSGGGEYLRREYEDLRREYEDLRRPFFLTPSEEWGDVWRFKIEREAKHPTQKPIQLMRHIVKVSTRERATVLDPFMGSGTTGFVCAKLGRRFIGIERDPSYFELACKRIRDAYAQPDLFVEAPAPKPTQALMEF
jgi:adenine-specific DNA-methyltransferase